MVKGSQKSRSLRRVTVKTPGNRITTHYKERKPSKAKCAVCKEPLKGVPRETPPKLRKMNKSSRRPERPYGGKLCSKCLREELKKSLQG